MTPPAACWRAQTAHLVVVGELVSAITHDLRQPLTALAMNAAAACVPRSAGAVREALDALMTRSPGRRMRDRGPQDLAARRSRARRWTWRSFTKPPPRAERRVASRTGW
jgi:signal transduction histidine kinase